MRKKVVSRLSIKALKAVLFSLVCWFILTYIILKFYFIFMEKKPHLGLDKPNFIFLIPLFLSMLSFVVVFLLLVNRRVKYVRYIIQSVKKIESAEYVSHIYVEGNDEFAELAQSINIMNGRLYENIQKEKKLEESKYELITSVSHDLKTPLTSLIGYLELLDKQVCEKEDKKQEYISIAYQKSIRMKELVNDLFEYTRLSGNEVLLIKEKANVSALLNQMAGESVLDFEERNITVVLDNPYIELYSFVDMKLITRVFDNIIGNAKKYSDADSKFLIRVEATEERIIISFVNYCKSLKNKDVSRIFDKFYRMDMARSSEKEGTGLGLTIAQEIIRLHKGLLKVDKQGERICFKVGLERVE